MHYVALLDIDGEFEVASDTYHTHIDCPALAKTEFVGVWEDYTDGFKQCKRCETGVPKDGETNE